MRISYFIGISFLVVTSCFKENKNELSIAIGRLSQSDERSCEAITATKYETTGDLLNDFYSTAKYKDSLELNLRLGTHYYYHGDYDSALYFYKQAEQIDTTEAELYFNISLAYCEKEEFETALKFIDKAMSKCSPKWGYLNSKCYILGKLNRCEEAVAVGLISKELNPENKTIYGNLLRCFDKQSQADSVKKYIGLIDSKFNQTTEWIDELRVKYK